VNDLSATPRKILRGTVVNGVSHLGENFDREGLFHADYGGARTGRAPAVEHARRGKAGENADQQNSAGGGHVLSGGVVTHIQSAAGDDLGEAGEASVPEGGSGAATGYGAFHAGSLFAARAFIDEEGGSGGEEAEQSLFERVRDALGGVFAYSQADRDVGGGREGNALPGEGHVGGGRARRSGGFRRGGSDLPGRWGASRVG